MQIEAQAAELKSAVGAIVSVMKKMPTEVTATDAAIALVRKPNGYSVTCVFDWFSATIPLPSMKDIGQATDLVPWTGGRLTEKSMIGIVDETLFSSVLSKIKGEIILEYTQGNPYVTVKDKGSGKYTFDVSEAKKIKAMNGVQSQKEEIASFDNAQFQRFCERITELGGVVSPSVSKPGFGCVCLSSEPNEDGTENFMRLSGNSDIEGFSVVCDTKKTCKTDFTALLPKTLAEGIKGFAAQLPSTSETVLHIMNDDKGVGAQLVLVSDKFELSLSLMRDFFPFKQIDKILQIATTQYCEINVPGTGFKSTLAKVTILAKQPESQTSLLVYDTGTMMLKQYDGFSNGKPVAEDKIDNDIIRFPNGLSNVETTVKTSVLKKMAKVFSNGDFSINIAESTNAKANGNLAFFVTEEDGTTVTGVQLGTRKN